MDRLNKEKMKTRLMQLRSERNMTQKELATILKMDPSTIANYESGERKPKYEHLLRIADYFGVSIDWILGRTNSPYLSTIELAVKGFDPRIRKLILEDPENALPALNFTADCIESGIPVEQIRELFKNILAIRKELSIISKKNFS